LAPPLPGLARGLDRRLDVGLPRTLERAYDLAFVGRIATLDRLAGARLNPFAVDKIPVGLRLGHAAPRLRENGRRGKKSFASYLMGRDGKGMLADAKTRVKEGARSSGRRFAGGVASDKKRHVQTAFRAPEG